MKLPAKVKRIVRRLAYKLHLRRIKRVPLPKGTLFVNSYKKCPNPLRREVGVVIVFQREPEKRTALMGNGRYFLAFPYSIFLLRFRHDPKKNLYFYNGLKVGFRSKPLTSIDDNLYLLPISNVFDDHRVCMGDVDDLQKPFEDLGVLAETVMSYFWQTQFSHPVYELADWTIASRFDNPDLECFFRDCRGTLRNLSRSSITIAMLDELRSFNFSTLQLPEPK